MIQGKFVERPADAHVRQRQELLSSCAVLPPPRGTVHTAKADEFPDLATELLLPDLRAAGFAAVRLDTPLDNDRFRAFGDLLGTPMPERDPAVQPFVEDGVILNLVTRHGHTDDANLAPFARNYLSLHSEGSGRALAGQPHYIVLMCVEPGDDVTAARTVLVPMAGVAERLTDAQLATLAGTRYADNDQAPMIARRTDGRIVFSFRDFLDQPLHWTHGGDGTPDDVTDALRALLAAMYAPGAAYGVHWAPNLLIVLDNTFSFHGRTAGATGACATDRHLKRLRVV